MNISWNGLQRNCGVKHYKSENIFNLSSKVTENINTDKQTVNSQIALAYYSVPKSNITMSFKGKSNIENEKIKSYTRAEKTKILSEMKNSYEPIYNDNVYRSILLLDDVHFNRFLKYANKKDFSNYVYRKNAYEIACLNDEEYEKFQVFTKIKNQRLDIPKVIEYIKKTDKNSEEFKKISSVIDNYGQDIIFRSFEEISDYSSLSKLDKERINELRNIQKDNEKEASVTLKIARLEQDKYDKVIDLMNSNIHDYNALKAADFNAFQIKAFKEYKNEGIDDFYGIKIIEKCADNREKINYISSVAKKLFDEGYDSYHIAQMADLETIVQCKQYVELSDKLNKESKIYIFNLANVSKENFSKIKFLLNKKIRTLYINDVVTKSQQRIDDLMILENESNVDSFLMDYSMLDNKNAKKFMEIYNLGMDPFFIERCIPKNGEKNEEKNEENHKKFINILSNQSTQTLLKLDRTIASDYLCDLFNRINNGRNISEKELNNIEILSKNDSWLSLRGKNSEALQSLMSKLPCTKSDNLKKVFLDNDLRYVFANTRIKSPTHTIADLLEIWPIQDGMYTLLGEDNDTISKLAEISNSKYIRNLNKDGELNSRDLIILSKIPNLDIDNIKNVETIIENQRKQLINYPDLYINGEIDDKEKKEEMINKFFDEGHYFFILANSVFDKTTMDVLLRKRMSAAKDYISRMAKFSPKELILLSDLISSSNISGKPFSEKQKIEFIDLIESYKKNGLDMTNIKEMVKKGIVDVDKLNKDLFVGILMNCGLTEEEISRIPIDKMTSWDMKYMHLLSKAVAFNTSYSDLIRAANLDDFNRYIHDTSNTYGETNANTKKVFEENGINYEKWLKPSEKNNIQFVSKDENTEHLVQIASLIAEDMESLMQTPVKGFIKKQFPNFVKDDEFIVPNQYLTSKAKLAEFVQSIIAQMQPVFERARQNLENPNKKDMAQNTLTIENHLNQRIDDIKKVPDINSSNYLNLTIKMWDRIPQKDIFQGNYSTCCIGIGDINDYAMPHYLMNTAYNMIELNDNTTGKPIGNALCYFVQEENGKLAFIVDNIEISNSHKPSNKVGIEIRNAITQYAANVSKEVTGRDDISIYMSAQYNDVPYEDLDEVKQIINFVGDIDCDEIYMDLYGGKVQKQKLFGWHHSLLKLK